MKKFLQKLFGYTTAKDKSIPDTDDSEIVLFVFDKFNEYTENPPQELVQSILDSFKIKGEDISYEDAKALVPYTMIKKYIAKEARKKFKTEFTKNLSFLRWLSE